VSGSEDGDIIFWDVRSKEVAQKVSGHEGVVCWVDTSPVPGTLVSGGLDGTVRIWVDMDADDDEVGGMNGLQIGHASGDGDVDMVKIEPDDAYDGTRLDGSRDNRRLAGDTDKMDEDQ
jgi:COMPASS component SWD3